jgi:predicted DCC family thiol-disulfide oxidoreductase YuxK
VSETTSKPIVLYDGVCGLCNGLVQFVLKRDRYDKLLFASLQSDFAASILQKHGRDARDLDTVCVVVNRGQRTEKVLARSDAIICIGQELGGIWKVAVLGKFIPRFLRDAAYRLVAKYRYRIFGKHDTCMLPDPKQRGKFIEI